MTDHSDRLWADEIIKDKEMPTKTKKSNVTLANFGVPITEGRGGILMPKLQNRFRVKFGNSYKDNIALTQQLIKCGLPSITFNTKYDEKYNSYTAESPTWEPISFSFRNDLPSTALKTIVEFLEKQLKDQSLEFAITIELLDGGGDKVVTTYQMEGCQILRFDSGSMDYASSKACEMVLVIKYKNAIIS